MSTCDSGQPRQECSVRPSPATLTATAATVVALTVCVQPGIPTAASTAARGGKASPLATFQELAHQRTDLDLGPRSPYRHHGRHAHGQFVACFPGHHHQSDCVSTDHHDDPRDVDTPGDHGSTADDRSRHDNSADNCTAAHTPAEHTSAAACNGSARDSTSDRAASSSYRTRVPWRILHTGHGTGIQQSRCLVRLLA